MFFCPYCEAEISENAMKCKYCGEWVQEQPAPVVAPTPTPRAEREYAATPYANQTQISNQSVSVNVNAGESSTFAVITLVCYLFIYPLGFLLNLVGVLTGPRRGCFLSLLIFFVGIPAIVVFGIIGLSIPEIQHELQKLLNR